MAVSKSSCQPTPFVEGDLSQQALAGKADVYRLTQAQATKRENGRLIKLVASRNSNEANPQAERVIRATDSTETSSVNGLSSDAALSDAALSVAVSPERGILYPKLKRFGDVVGASALLVGFSPLMLGVAVAIKMTSKGPVIFRQTRLTRGGKVFTILKFRTMRQDAEALTGAVWAAERDPRITKLGHYLRTLRIDELPQLLNVITGDMSLIGPRPERPEFATKLQEQLPSFNRRLEVKAGITGLAQVGAGYAADVESYRKKLALDRVYIKNRGFLMDLRIALRTVVVMLTGQGR